MKKIIVSVLIVLFLGGVGAYVYFSGKEYEVRITEEQIRQKLNQKLPFTKKYLFTIEVTLDNPRIKLVEGTDRVKGGMDVTLNIKLNDESRPFGGSVDATSGIMFSRDQGQFFLIDPVIDNLQVQGFPDKYVERANKVLAKALAEYYRANPIYTLKQGDAKQLAAKLVLKRVFIETKELVLILGI